MVSGRKHEEREHREVLNWVTPVDYGPQYSDILTERHCDIGQWLLDSPEYQAWLEGKKRTLFCHGIHGAGMTVLSAIVIRDVYSRFQNVSNIGIAYIFCNVQRHGEQTLEHLLMSLLKQFVQRQDYIPGNVKAFMQAQE
ncbi:uncharacterized protein ATNIH1004_002608 [Aspergillus tanneri]|uniref:Nephrocystin 3-like N-terminal domain-containing protein n=1 Tax=Aspergillus tanneri TaxID=1220188 RepID=A0A5M9MZ49_9EURO|nr:uncharacterized protein ATNIH1004_002608 [Aspergillus tanneri]KAA8649929.1 hypothetical protein ATNIH1004_002608 [Aspergillus tanneri]